MNKGIIIKLILILGIFLGVVFLTIRYSPIQSQRMDSTLITEEEKFTNFFDNVLESRCPYYKLDGVTYKDCLDKILIELELKKASLLDNQTKQKINQECHDSPIYGTSEENSGAYNAMYSSCLIYKITNL